jgi:hypothetical protein
MSRIAQSILALLRPKAPFVPDLPLLASCNGCKGLIQRKAGHALVAHLVREHKLIEESAYRTVDWLFVRIDEYERSRSMRGPRSGAWRVYSRTPERKLIACWASVFVIDRFDTEIDEHGHEKTSERVSRPPVQIYRAPGSSVPIVIPKTRSTFLHWETIRKFQLRAGFIAAQIKVEELNSRSLEHFHSPWEQLDRDQCLAVLAQIGAE